MITLNENKTLTKYKPGTRVQKSNMGKIIVIAAGIALAAGVIGIAFTGSSGLQTANDNNKPMVMHIHPGLSMAVDGQDTAVPKNIGIDSSLWKGHSLDQYGMQGMSPLHTHDTSGTIHVESNEQRDFTFGEFLDVWDGIDTSKITRVTVDGNAVSDYNSHVMKDGENIRLEVTS